MSGPVVAVAWSGGRDSTALLHATLRAAAPLGIAVLALHVHHGLSPDADAWLAFCARRAAAWRRAGLDLVFRHARLAERPADGESVEAWARRQRYRALHAMASEAGATIVLLAHHRRDQAETFLLQALRGAGVAGLAGMPRAAERDRIVWARPWLDRPREAVEAYVRRHRLTYVDDDSNADARFARNRLRHAVWPALLEAFPHAESALADSAAWAAQAHRCLDDLARTDLATLQHARGGLDLVRWTRLEAHRRTNALRRWLHDVTGRAAPVTLVQRLLLELDPVRDKRWPVEHGVLHSHRGALLHVPSEPAVAPSARETVLQVRRAGRRELPGWGGVLVFRRVDAGGVPTAWLGHLELRPRVGAEQFQAGFGRPPRSLKKQYQAADVPRWQRDGPLVYSGGQLVFVPGLGIDARVIAPPGQPQMDIAWEPAGGLLHRSS